MVIYLEPEIGVPMGDGVASMDLTVRAKTAANTIAHLADHGVNVEPNKEDEDVAARLAMAYAENPENTSRKVTTVRASKLTPPSLLLVNNILQEFGQSIAESATQIRHLVTNKLIEETENPDPRVRIRALELLGKISDVGLFTEKTEITITHQTTDDLKANLRAKLAKLVNPEQGQEDVVDAVVIDGDEIDVDAEFGIDEEEDSAEDDAETEAEQDFDAGAENSAENAEADSENAMQDPEPQAPVPEKADKDMEAAMKEALEDDLVQENDPKWGQ
jgi:hypothetical protein